MLEHRFSLVQRVASVTILYTFVYVCALWIFIYFCYVGPNGSVRKHAISDKLSTTVVSLLGLHWISLLLIKPKRVFKLITNIIINNNNDKNNNHMSEKYIYSIVLLCYCIFNWEQSSIKYKIWSILLIYKVANCVEAGHYRFQHVSKLHV